MIKAKIKFIDVSRWYMLFKDKNKKSDFFPFLAILGTLCVVVLVLEQLQIFLMKLWILNLNVHLTKLKAN